jgi:hypothetical protein
MLPFYHAAHAMTLSLALLLLAATFVMILLGWAVHGLIAALLFSSLFVLAQELRAALLIRRPARIAPPRR